MRLIVEVAIGKQGGLKYWLELKVYFKTCSREQIQIRKNAISFN